jgi:hypothetical protein
MTASAQRIQDSLQGTRIMVRHLPPVYTDAYEHIPLLRKKLKWLYGRHPLVRSQKKLAGELRVAPSTLSGWLNGIRFEDPGSVAPLNPDCIPKKHYRTFVDIWGLDEKVLMMEDLDVFKNALARQEERRSPWETLILSVADNDAIEVCRQAERGAYVPAEVEERGIPQFRIGEEFLVRVPRAEYKHAVMLLQDRSGWSSLLPTERWPSTEVGGDLVYPRQPDEMPTRFARFDSVGGIHRLLVALMEEAPPAGIVDLLLSDPINVSNLDHLVPVLHSRLAAKECTMLSRRVFVAHG